MNKTGKPPKPSNPTIKGEASGSKFALYEVNRSLELSPFGQVENISVKKPGDQLTELMTAKSVCRTMYYPKNQ